MFQEMRTSITAGSVILMLGGMGVIPSAANGPNIGWDGGSIVPLGSKTIRLLGERVSARLDGEGYPGGSVNVQYWLSNLSKRTESFEMAFLIPAPPYLYMPDPSWKHEYKFRVWAAGAEVPVQWQPADTTRWREFTDGQIDSLPTWHLTIPAGDTMVVLMDYLIQASGGADGDNYGVQFRYQARPAALWAGRLEFAEFNIYVGKLAREILHRDPWLEECDRVEIQPAGWFWNADAINWRFEEWEPDQDITIDMDCTEPTSKSRLLGGPAESLDLPDYSGDRVKYGQESILGDLLKSFLNPRNGYPVRVNYLPYAMAYLLVRRHEIEARHGARFADDSLQRYFSSLWWYKPDPAYRPGRLNDMERANQDFLKRLEKAIIADPGLLPDLPARPR